MILGTQDKDFFPTELQEKFRYIKSIGFDCLELDGKLLVARTEDIKQAIAASGLKVLSVCGGYEGWIGDFEESRRQKCIADIKTILPLIKEIGGTGIVIPAAWGMFTYRLPPMVSPRTKAEDQAIIIDSLKALEPVAKANGVYLYLEPLNRYQDHMLNTLQDALDIIEQGQFTQVKITADFYHMAIEEDDISQSLRKYAPWIGHIHIAENHRYQPGTGSIDFSRHLKTLREIGYTGAIVNEGRIRGENPVQAYEESVQYIKPFLSV